VVLWVVLVVGANVVLLRLGRSLWRKAAALVSELDAAADRLAVVTAELRAEPETVTAEEPAVFADPGRLRRQRFLASRQARRGAPRRRAGWAPERRRAGWAPDGPGVTRRHRRP
jgi:hypothetical protein